MHRVTYLEVHPSNVPSLTTYVLQLWLQRLTLSERMRWLKDQAEGTRLLGAIWEQGGPTDSSSPAFSVGGRDEGRALTPGNLLSRHWGAPCLRP